MEVFNAYKSMMDRLDPPNHLNDTVLEVINTLREDDADKTRPRGCCRKHLRADRGKRRPYVLPALAAGLTAASLIVGAIITIPSALMNGNEDFPFPDHPAQTASGIFGLALYADASETGQSVYIATDESGITPNGGMGGPRPSALQYLINLKCVGENIDTVTYEIKGEDVRLELMEMKDSEFDDSLNPNIATYSKSITVTYDEQYSPYYIQRIEVDTRTPEERENDLYYIQKDAQLNEHLQNTDDPDEQARIRNEIVKLDNDRTHYINGKYPDFQELGEEAYTKISEELYRSAVLDAAHKIGQSTLSVTAMFLDGTTAEKQYKIVPVDDLEQVLLGQEAAREEHAGNTELLESDPRMTAPFFTITEVI